MVPSSARPQAGPGVLGSLRAWLPRGRTLPDRDWCVRHRAILALLRVHAVGLPIGAFWAEDGYSAHLLAEVLVVVVLAVLASLDRLGRSLQGALASLGLIASSALLVHIGGGYVELHFHFFVMVAVIALYQDWVPFLLALASVVVEHGIVGVLTPRAVYNHPDAWANPWLWAAIHGGFVLAASAASIVSWRLNEATQERVAGVRAHLAEIVESSRDPIVSWTRDGRIVSWNPAAERLYGHTADEIVGQPGTRLVSPNIPAGRPRLLDLLRQSERIEDFRTVHVRKDGSPVEVSLTAFPVLDGAGRMIGFATIARDISARREMERALERARDAAVEASRAKSEFLATMSHEIRTPMNGVIGMTGLLLDTPLTIQQREYAEALRRSGEALLLIINDILDFSKIEAGRLDLEQEPVDVGEIVEDVVGIAAGQAHARGLELAAFVDPATPRDLLGDAGRLRQVLTNLVGNAVKFTPAGEVVVRAGPVAQTSEAVELRFEVRDTGIGIAPAARERLFEAFTQAESSTTRRFGGTGLGLAISKRLVALMGGAIDVESEEGRGSTFWFTVRLARPSGPTAPPSPARRSLGDLHVLVVDDNATNRQILLEQVGGWGMAADSAADGEQALGRLRRAAAAATPFDLALLDMQMPGMDGLDLARAIKADPAIAPTRLVLLTSLGGPEVAADGRDAGIAAALTKPVRPSQLFDVLARTMAEGSADSAVAAGPAAPPPLVRLWAPGRRVLVAEDNPVNQQVARAMLERLGCRVDVVGDGHEAVEALRHLPYDVVFMDVQMPGMDGFEATREIRRHEVVHRTPIIAMTANALEGDRERCLAAGMDDYLAKPVRPPVLEVVLSRWLGPNAAPAPEPAVVAAPAPPGPVLDAAVLESLRDLREPDGPDPLAELVALFVRDVPPRLEALREAVSRGDAEALRLGAHAVKGSAGALGAVEMRDLSARLEALGRQGDAAPAVPLVAELQAAFDRTRAALHAELTTPSLNGHS